MIPTTDLIYNYDYAERLYQGNDNFKEAWERIIRIGADFEEIYEEHIDHILEAIEKYSGFSWEEYAEDSLPIYLVDSKPSFVHPLTLTVNEDPEMMLRDFIYQLAHRNMYFGFKNKELQDKSFCLVTDCVLEDLGLQQKERKEWDLEKKNIKEYLGK